LVSTQLSESDYNDHCKNNTGVKVSQENISGNPNGTSTGGDDAEPSSTTSGGGSSPAATGAATQAKVVSWMLGAAGVVGMAML
jgi:hypothetical protein